MEATCPQSPKDYDKTQTQALEPQIPCSFHATPHLLEPNRDLISEGKCCFSSSFPQRGPCEMSEEQSCSQGPDWDSGWQWQEVFEERKEDLLNP